MSFAPGFWFNINSATTYLEKRDFLILYNSSAERMEIKKGDGRYIVYRTHWIQTDAGKMYSSEIVDSGYISNEQVESIRAFVTTNAKSIDEKD